MGDQATDEMLLKRYVGGDVQALGTLLERYERRLFNFLLRWERDPQRASDLMQETFVRVMERAASFRGQSKFSTWLYTIARNLYIDTHRKRSRERLTGDWEGTERAGISRQLRLVPAPDKAYADQALATRLELAVAELPDAQREVFLLRHVEHLPFREIAQVLDVSENTVKSRMRYALERLRDKLEAAGEAPERAAQPAVDEQGP